MDSTAARDKNTIYHEEFLLSTLKYIINDRKKAEENGELKAMVPYGKMKEIFQCPEPLLFVSEFNALGNNKNQCRRLFEEKKEKFQMIRLPNEYDIWWNTSQDRINIRLGIDNNNQPSAMALGDTTVHGLIAGQTGSGKSVLLHSLIFNLLAEYPPWELDLYLADFKRVEFSKYMDEAHSAPHVVACAATGEIRYVLSLIQHIVDCMNAREDFFKRMGYEKIAKFRDSYPDIALPRILLIVDEFQQLFLDASTKENELIQRMLTAIVKKGRATGVHLIFASQEMSQTLSRSALSNFRMRIALNCDSNVSMDVLGNREAANLEKNYVYVNNTDGSAQNNRKFHVPFANDRPDENNSIYFDEYLEGISKRVESFNYSKNTKFYQEDFQEPLTKLTEILGKIRPYKEKIRSEYFDALTLGRYVTFSPLKYDIQTLFIERGRNRNIMSISSNLEDICYMQKLLALNFSYGDSDKPQNAFHHMIFSFMPATESVYRLDKDLREMQGGGNNIQVFRNPEDFSRLQEKFKRLRFMLPLYQEAESPLAFALMNYERNIAEEIRRRPELKKERKACIPIITERLKDVTFENAEEICSKLSAEEGKTVMGKIAENVIEFCKYKKDAGSVLPPTVIWLVGIDIIERLPDWFLYMLKNGMDYNLLFVCMAGTDFDSMMQIAKSCDYLFLGGNNKRIYDRLAVNFTSRESDSIALDTVIKSSGEERSFKKYRCSFGKHESARIPFEDILG